MLTVFVVTHSLILYEICRVCEVGWIHWRWAHENNCRRKLRKREEKKGREGGGNIRIARKKAIVGGKVEHESSVKNTKENWAGKTRETHRYDLVSLSKKKPPDRPHPVAPGRKAAL